MAACVSPFADWSAQCVLGIGTLWMAWQLGLIFYIVVLLEMVCQMLLTSHPPPLGLYTSIAYYKHPPPLYDFWISTWIHGMETCCRMFYFTFCFLFYWQLRNGFWVTLMTVSSRLESRCHWNVLSHSRRSSYQQEGLNVDTYRWVENTACLSPPLPPPLPPSLSLQAI